MIPLFSRAAVRAIDAASSAKLGLPTLLFMENAGKGAFDVLCAHYPLERVAIVGGVGQNGGDGWVVARHLLNAGFAPRCVLIGARDKVRGDAAINLAAIETMGSKVASVTDAADPQLAAALERASVIVDGLFGTGLDRKVEGLYADVIARLNAAAAPILALDIPSGVDADTGGVLGTAIEAERTVTFAVHKLGLQQHPGAGLAGAVHLATIGVPPPPDAEWLQLEAADVAGWLPPRIAHAHKGTGGHVLVIAGAPGRTGAALLSGLGALRAGAGLVTLCPRAGAQGALDMKVVELMTFDLPAAVPAAVDAVKGEMAKKNAAVIGPGFGTDDAAKEIIRRLAVELDKPCVLDADALTAFGTELAALRNARAPRVLTPHPAEAARLLGVETPEVQADRYGAAKKLAAESGQWVVLKGARTLIAEPNGRGRLCPLDVPALAVGGTGDVLSGVVGALLGGGHPPFDAAAAGVYLHARAGMLAARSDRGLFAREVADALPEALEACRAGG